MVDRLGQESIYTFSTCSYCMKHHLNHPNPYWHPQYPRLMSTSITVLNLHADGRSFKISMYTGINDIYEVKWLQSVRKWLDCGSKSWRIHRYRSWSDGCWLHKLSTYIVMFCLAWMFSVLLIDHPVMGVPVGRGCWWWGAVYRRHTGRIGMGRFARRERKRQSRERWGTELWENFAKDRNWHEKISHICNEIAFF